MQRKKIQKLTTLSMLCAISIVLVYSVRIPMFLPFLEYDPADIPIMIGTFLFGPAAGMLLLATVSVIQGLTVSASSGVIGIIMHIFATGGFVLVAGNIYRKKRNRSGAIIALSAGVVTMVISMVIWNIIFTPIFMGTPREAVIALLVPAILPFNIIKAGVNAIVTFLVYKPISNRLSQKMLDNDNVR